MAATTPTMKCLMINFFTEKQYNTIFLMDGYTAYPKMNKIWQY